MKNRVVNVISEIRSDIDFDDNTKFIEEGIFDSFDIVNLVSELDAEFDISIDGVKIRPEYFNSIDDIVKLVTESA